MMQMQFGKITKNQVVYLKLKLVLIDSAIYYQINYNSICLI